jgi:ribosomal protein L21
MYGVVEISGHQYRVQAGDVLDVQKLTDEEGKTIELDQYDETEIPVEVTHSVEAKEDSLCLLTQGKE